MESELSPKTTDEELVSITLAPSMVNKLWRALCWGETTMENEAEDVRSERRKDVLHGHAETLAWARGRLLLAADDAGIPMEEVVRVER